MYGEMYGKNYGRKLTDHQIRIINGIHDNRILQVYPNTSAYILALSGQHSIDRQVVITCVVQS